MSFHVYISNPGFKEEPIRSDDWVQAAKELADANPNVVLAETNHGTTIRLTKSSRQRMHLDHYGLIHAQDPNRELIENMFAIALKLNAKVYSEKLKAYESTDDWERRTQPYRQRRDERRAIRHRERNVKMVLWLLGITIFLLAIYFLT